MADVMRWRYGETNPIVLPVDAATVIEIGDLVYLETDDVRPASSQADQGSEAANQELFHDKFAGVAMTRKRAGETKSVRVATTGVFEFDMALGTAEVGELFGVDENAGGTALLNQTVDQVSTPNLAIGRCVKRVQPADTKVLVEIVSTVTLGGPQAMA